MTADELMNLLKEIRKEYKRLKVALETIPDEKGKVGGTNIRVLDNLFKGLMDWVKKPDKEEFLFSAKILNYNAKKRDEKIISKQDKNRVYKAVSVLKYQMEQSSKGYYKTIGKNSNIIFSIVPKGKEAKYQLKVKIDGIDFKNEVKRHYIEKENKYFTQETNRYQKVPYFFLRPAEDVLQIKPRIHIFDEPKFFRKTGPIAKDIENARVYIRPEVDNIINLLNTNKNVYLHGLAASGKTVIASITAYRWIEKGHKVKFIQLRDFIDPIRLIEEIFCFGNDYSDPLLVIEDAHLKEDIFNNLLSHWTDTWPKLLITSRNDNPNIYSRNVNYYHYMEVKKIIPFNTTDEIISMFFNSHEWKINETIKKEIKNISKNSLWVLSYALMSMTESNGKEINWKILLKEVEKDLTDIVLMNNSTSAEIRALFPSLLIILSILYRYEIPTDLRYLYQIFPHPATQISSALEKLVIMKEALLLEYNGNRLYGLPHSSLADLYFCLLKKYAINEHVKFIDVDSFISDYIASDKSINGLELFEQFMFYSQTKKIFFTKNILNKLNIKNLALKIMGSHNLIDVGYCISILACANPNIAIDLLKYLDKEKLSNIITASDNYDGTANFIRDVYSIDTDFGKELLNCIEIKLLAKNMSGSKNILKASWLIQIFFNKEPDLCLVLCENLNMEKLARNISEEPDLYYSILFIEVLFEVSPYLISDLFRYLDKNKLAINISQCDNSKIAGEYLCFLYEADQKIANEVFSYIDKRMLALNATKADDVFGIDDILSAFFKDDPNIAKEFLSYLDKNKIALKFNKTENYSALGSCISNLFRIDPELGMVFWSYVDKETIALKITKIDHYQSVLSISGFVRSIFEADPEIGREFWRYIDKEKLAFNLSEPNNCSCIDRFLESIFEADPEIGREFWCYIDKEKLAFNLSEPVTYTSFSKFLSTIIKIDPEIKKEFLEHLDIEKLALSLTVSNNLERVYWFMEEMYNNHRSLLKRIWKHVDKETLADTYKNTNKNMFFEILLKHHLDFDIVNSC